MEAAGDGIWDWDIVSDVVTHNTKWGELFGFEAGELQHPIEVFAALLHEDDRAEVQRALQNALTSTGTYQHQHRMVRRDGTVIHVFDRGRVVEWDAEGNATRMAGAVSDVTERIDHEVRLRIVTDALIDANVSLERKVDERTAELARANAELQNLAWRDSLTGLPNRLSGMNHLESEFARMCRTDARSSVLMMDVDHFKPINDTYGHGVGDEVLKHIAGVITRSLRTGDFVARFGGEEFVALLPDTDLEGARVVAEKIRKAVEDATEPTAGRLTISIGATIASPADHEMSGAVRRADAALYEAKRSGRNRVIVREPDSD
jgi:diguanylate cyclase (GGDEF)-like protein/PAS domain S-box-containing protein